MKKKDMQAALEAARGLREHYEELFKASVKIGTFYQLQTEFLRNALEEIATVDSAFAKEIAELTIKRHALEKNIHNNHMSNVNEE